MTLAGTRPPLIGEVSEYELHHRARLAIKPGITGMWQVSGRSDITDFEEVVELDKEYIENWNMKNKYIGMSVPVKAAFWFRVISSTFVTAVIGIVLYVTVFKSGKSFFDRKVWFFSLGFCIPLMPHYLSEFVLQSSDKIMINYLCGTSDVALYSIAYSAGSLINLITGAINSTFAPYQYQKIKAGEYELLAKRANQVLLFVGVMLAGIMLFSREIVLVFGGAKYIESVDVIIPICIGVYFNYMFQLFARVQEYYERKLTVVIPSILCAVLNLILNYIFIKLCGYQAAAYTTFVCYAIFCLIHYYFYKKVCKEVLNGQRLYDGKGILLISIGVTIIGMAVAFINHFLWLKYSIIIAILILLIMKRNTVINIVKNMLGKKK